MTLPNKLTLGRILALPFVLWCFYSPHFTWYVIGYFMGWIFGLTDFVDGYLARKLGQISMLGKILDPIADKLFVLLVSVYFVDVGILPFWVLVLLIFREVVISDFRLFALKHGKEVAVSRGGKWKAFLQYFLLAYLGMMKLFLFDEPRCYVVPLWDKWAQIVYVLFVGVVIFLTLASLFEYVWTNRALFRRSVPRG